MLPNNNNNTLKLFDVVRRMQETKSTRTYPSRMYAIIFAENFEFSAQGDGDGSVVVTADRHRRSYESRHNKGKGDNVEKGPAKTQGTVTAGGSKSGSVFATENCTVVVAQIGGTATLPCVVKKFNTAVVR